MSLRAHEVLEAGTWNLADAVDRVVLDIEDRRRRRLTLDGCDGVSFVLDLAQVPDLKDGDGLRLTDGRIVAVVPALEQLTEISAVDADALMRIAWHLGNRHLPTELDGDRLRIRSDHVIEDMVRGLGGETRHLSAAFTPEGGAYGHGPVHGHDHGHTHDHGLAHGADHTHDHNGEDEDPGGVTNAV